MRRFCLHGAGCLVALVCTVELAPKSDETFGQVFAYFLGHLISTLFTAELLTLQWFMSKLRDGQADVIQAFMPVACITLAFSIHCSIVICCEFMESWALAVAYCVSMHVLAVDFGLFSGRFLLWLEGELRW
jgi:hypothetical protein